MAKHKGNMFAAAQAEREQEQETITAAVTKKSAPIEPKAAEHGEGQQEKITLSISRQDKMTVKIYAAQHATTISALLHEWITEHCTE